MSVLKIIFESKNTFQITYFEIYFLILPGLNLLEDIF